MSKVTRYSGMGSTWTMPSENGDYVKYDDYAALEASSAALAAENAALKAANAEGCRWDGEQWVGLSNETPATESFLAEVRAQGAEECVRQLVISDDDDFSDAPNICAMVAYQLRQDANTAELVAAGIITKVGE